MRRGSLLYGWYLEEYKNQPMKVRAVESLLRSGHTGLAESVVVRSLRAKYKTTATEGLKVNYGGKSYFI